jgi:hypothetical protein
MEGGEISPGPPDIGSKEDLAAAWVALRIMSLRFKARLEMALVIDSIESRPEEWFPPELSWSESLLLVGWHPDTRACRIFRPPSHLSLRIACTASWVSSEVGSISS